jgi:hypothetical protein
MKSQLTFTPELLTCGTLYYLTLLLIYERLKILAMYCYLNLTQPEEDWPPLIAWFL